MRVFCLCTIWWYNIYFISSRHWLNKSIGYLIDRKYGHKENDWLQITVNNTHTHIMSNDKEKTKTKIDMKENKNSMYHEIITVLIHEVGQRLYYLSHFLSSFYLFLFLPFSISLFLSSLSLCSHKHSNTRWGVGR